MGRTAQREVLLGILRESRLVTLVGAPGVGKTRLAREVAGGAAEFSSSAWWVDLDPIRDVDGVVPTLARALKVRKRAGAPLLEAVLAKLHGRQVLIVLDNCEHLIETCTATVQALLASSEGIWVLATSREPLGIVGERRWEVATLSVPDVDDSPEAVAATEAGQLFCQRAITTQPDFVLDAATAPAVAETCRRLDGLPLAIELAAARLAVLSVTEIAERLDDRFALLRQDQASVRARHQTLLAALEWSYHLLSPPEQALLRRLAVFRGAATLEAVRAVCTGPNTEPADALELLTGLATKSLVVVETPGTGPARYRFLETVHVYATRRLADAGEESEATESHARWFTTFAELARPQLTGSRPDQWVSLVSADYDNLSDALRWTLEHTDGDDALRLASSLTMYWRLRGQFAEGRQLLDQARAHCRDAPAALRAEALWGAGLLALMMGDAQAGQLLEVSLQLYQGIDDIAGQSRAALLLANHLLFQPDPSKAEQQLEQSVSLAREANDAWCLAHGLALSAQVQLNEGNTSAGRRLLEEAFAVAREAQEPQGARMALTLLGRLAALEGDYPVAERLLDEALSITRRLDEPPGTAAALRIMASVAAGRGEYSRAEELLEESLALERLSGGGSVGSFLLGRTLLDTGDRQRAEQLFRDVLVLVGPSSPDAYPVLAGLALVAALKGDGQRARALLDDALGLTVPGNERFRPGSLLSELQPGSVLYDLGNVARELGEREEATRLHIEAFQLRESVGDLPGMVKSAEALGGLHAEAGHTAVAMRMLAAAQAVRDSHRFARAPVMQDRYSADLEAERSMLEAGEFEDLWADGAKLSLSEAVRYATRRRGTRSRPGRGWESLTRTELDVARLVAEGLSNPEVAERLFVSRNTVQNHLKHVFIKLGVSSRVELAVEATRRAQSADSQEMTETGPAPETTGR